MDHLDTLHTIAEIAVALAGFTGIVVIFGTKSETWDASEVFRLRTLLRASLSALFCSFLPIVVNALDPLAAYTWELSAAVIAAVILVNMAVFWARSMGSGAVVTTSQHVYSLVASAVVVALVGASVGWVPSVSTVVVIGLVWQLFVAAQNFILLLVAGVAGEG